MNFSGGGSNVTINAFAFHPNAANPNSADGTFTTIGAGVSCAGTADNNGTPGGSGIDMCAQVNSANTKPNWPTEDKKKPGQNPANTLETPEFVEGAINLTDAFHAAGTTPPACQGSFMAETRSSDTLSATLKDYALGALDTCGAKVGISPTQTNRVGTSHTFTVTAQQTADGSTFTPATTGDVSWTLAGSNGITAADITFDAAASTCDNDSDPGPAEDNLNASGQCTIVVNSTKTGKITANATVVIDLGGGSTRTVTTDGLGGNSGAAVKTYVNAWLDITGDGTNRVGANHDFKVTSYVDNGDGSGRVLIGGVLATVHFANALGTDPIADKTCTTSTTAGATLGTCTVSFSSTKTGTHTGTAGATISAGPTGGKIDINVTTTADATVAANQDALKTWVNAKITIGDDATNRVGNPHTFTVTVQKDAGDGSGFVAANGLTVTATKVAGGVGSITGGTCTTATTSGSGQCTVIVSSTTPGSIAVHASTSVTVGPGTGITFTVETDGTGLNSGNATKSFVDLRIWHRRQRHERHQGAAYLHDHGREEHGLRLGRLRGGCAAEHRPGGCCRGRPYPRQHLDL